MIPENKNSGSIKAATDILSPGKNKKRKLKKETQYKFIILRRKGIRIAIKEMHREQAGKCRKLQT